MTFEDYSQLNHILNDLDCEYLNAIIRMDPLPNDNVIAAWAWDGMNLIISSFSAAMTAMDLQEPAGDTYDGYIPYYLDRVTTYRMIGSMYQY